MGIIFLTILLGAFALLAWRNLRFALILLSGLLPIYLIRFDIGPMPSTSLEMLILACAVIWVARFKQWKKPKLELQKWIRPTILLIAAASFGVLVAPDVFSALGIWKAYFIEPILVAVMMLTTFDRKDWNWSLRALSVSAIILSLFTIIQYITGVGIPTPWDIELRVTSFFDYPNALGLFLAPIITLNLTLSFLRRQESIAIRIISIITVILGLIAITLSQTEAALVAIPAAVIITLLISNISKKKKWSVGTFAVIAILLSILTPAIRSKLLLQDYSGQVRVSQWTETVELLKDHPFFGAGLNGYPTALGPYHDTTLYEIFQYPHNIFLNTWVELGILGLIALFWFGFLTLRSIRRNDITNLALFAALLTIFIHGLVDVPYFKNDLSILTWIFLAAFITIQSNKKTSA